MTAHLDLGILTGPLVVDAEKMVVLDLCGALVRRGHRVSLLAGDGPLLPRFAKTGVTVATTELTGSRLLDLPRLGRLAGAVTRSGAKLLLVTEPLLERHASALYRRTRVPYVLQVPRAPRRGSLSGRGGRRAVVVPSRALRDTLTLCGRVPAEALRVVPGGVDPARYPDPPPPNVGGRRIVGSVSPLERGAGLPDLVDAIRSLTRNGWDLHLLLAGGGTEDERLRRFARDRGAAKHVTVTDLPTDFERIMTTIDIAVFPGREDGYSAATPQAMAASRPVVATGVGSTFSWVREGVTGFLAPPSRPRDLADRIAWLLDHPLRAVEMGLAGRRTVLDSFGADRMADEMERVCREALESAEDA